MAMDTEDKENFMAAVREFRCLYDKGIKDFKDLTKKENAWKEVSQRTNMTVTEAQNKYKNIRTSFGRYVKSLKPASGSGRDSIVLRPAYEHLR